VRHLTRQQAAPIRQLLSRLALDVAPINRGSRGGRLESLD
jgi:hypothetical protein